MTTLSTASSTQPLRVCRNCGLEAWTHGDLERFTIGPKSRYGRVNLCKKCRQHKRRKTPIVPYLRKCVDCGLIAWSDADLEKFVKAKKGKYGRCNLCMDCMNLRCRIGGRYYDSVSRGSKKWYYSNKDKVRVFEMNRGARSIDFLGERITFSFNIRKNVCSTCGKCYPEELKQQTRLHHEKYDRKQPLAHTVELCHSCHRILHAAKRKRIKGQFVR